ncbi:MAG: M13 family metallopeptidase [Myxococcales bacterium]|nr:M13 family metallopeptidase [Myxococcales bacterium]
MKRLPLAFRLSVGSLLIGSLLPALSTAAPPKQKPPKQNTTPAIVDPISPEQLDPKVGACSDFYRHAVGGWQDKNPIPPEFSSYGAFIEVRERNEAILKEILGAASTDAKATGVRKQVADFWHAAMDEATIETLGLAPLADDFAAIDAIDGVPALVQELARRQAIGTPGLFQIYVDADDKESTKYITILHQSGIGLPDRDYYSRTDEKSVEIQKAYQAHMGRMLILGGATTEDVTAQVAAIYALEARIAGAHMTLVEQRDPQKVYNKMTVEELAQKAPGFPWADFLAAVGVPAAEPLNVRQPGYFAAMATMVGEVELATWKAWLRWGLLRSSASYLPKAFVEEAFSFYGKTLTGAETMRERWKRVLGVVDGALGEALGQLYVEKAFPPAAKKRMLGLIDNLKVSLHESIEALDWMSAETKARARKKLDTLLVKVGYPDVWRDYSTLPVTRDGYLKNVRASNVFEMKRSLGKLGKPIDRGEWYMSPPTVNAYYNPTVNEIVFPAGILQPPFFYLDADDAVNYGAIGMVIGHELTHGYDDSGRQYDEQGNLSDWWTPADAEAYKARTALMVKQYAAYEALPGLFVNGELTLGENIADLGGLKVAFAALQKASERAGEKRTKKIGGFTKEQRFFLGYAQAWRMNMREQELRRRLSTDPHSPARYRVIGPLSNLPEFHASFGCKMGDAMVRPEAERPQIW